jgi:hypothetical protein
VHVRRALLLFAIVLMLAALVTSVSRPQRERESTGPPTTSAPEAAPGPGGTSEELRVPGPRGRRTARLTGGAAATLVVRVEEDGEVALPELGLTEPATPLAPARFELIGDQAGDYEIRFTPAEGGESRAIGRLVVGQEPL